MDHHSVSSPSTSSLPSESSLPLTTPPGQCNKAFSFGIASLHALSPSSWLLADGNIAATEAGTSRALSSCRDSFISRLKSSLAPIDIPPSTAHDAFSQLLFAFLMHPRASTPPLDRSTWFSPVIHSYKRLATGAVEFDAPIDAQLRSCLAASLLKISGISDIWRAKKGLAERDAVCKQLQTLGALGLCDITGATAKRIRESPHCGSFIEAVQSDCVAEFKRCSGPLIQELLLLFCSLWKIDEDSPATASQVSLSAIDNDWKISVTSAKTEVVACISSDQLCKLRSMYIHDQPQPQSIPDSQPVIRRFIEHVFACVCRFTFSIVFVKHFLIAVRFCDFLWQV